MRTRFLVVGTLVGAIVMFAWQSVSNAALPWYRSQMMAFENDSATVAALRASAPHNAIYASDRGVFAVMSIEPGVSSKSAQIGPMLGKQAVLDVVVALALCLLLVRLPPERAMRTAVTFGLAAALVTLVIEGSNVIWYGWPRRWAEVSVIDQAISFFLTGLALRAVARRTGGEAAMVPDTGGVRAQGGLPSSGATVKT